MLRRAMRILGAPLVLSLCAASCDGRVGDLAAGTPDASMRTVDAGAADGALPDVVPADGRYSDAGADTAVRDAPADVSILGSGSEAIAFHIDPAHSGDQSGDTLALPLVQRWSVALPGDISYPLVAGGRVFVTAVSAADETDLYALDEATGGVLWGPVALGGPSTWSGAAYENGRVFTVNAIGTTTAWDAVTGTQVWRVPMTAANDVLSPPTAFGGVLYFLGPGNDITLYALDETTGQPVWTVASAGGGAGGQGRTGVVPSPTLASSELFFDIEGETETYDSASGAPLWSRGGCFSATGTIAAFGGDVFTRDCNGDLIADAVTATLVGTFAATPIPAFASGMAFYVNSAVLSAYRLPPPPLEDGGPISGTGVDLQRRRQHRERAHCRRIHSHRRGVEWPSMGTRCRDGRRALEYQRRWLDLRAQRERHDEAAQRHGRCG